MILDRLEGRKPSKDANRPPLLALVLPAVLLVPLAGLWLLSTPPDTRERLNALEAKAESIRKATGGGGDLKAFPAGSVCKGEQEDAVESRINIALANTGMQIGVFDLSEDGPVQAGGLQALRLTLKANGTYESAIAALDVLNRAQPKLFVDNMALRNKVSEVELELEGRVFCR